MTGKTERRKGVRNKRGRNGRMTGRGGEREESIAGREDGQGEGKGRRTGGRKARRREGERDMAGRGAVKWKGKAGKRKGREK